MAQKDQRGRIKSELNEHGHSGRILAPVIRRYGGSSMARKHTASYNIGFSEAKADLFGGKAPVGALVGLLERIC